MSEPLEYDDVPECECCQTENPVGGLYRTKRRTLAEPFVEEVAICEVCYTTFCGSKFISGGVQTAELLALAQCINLIRKDITPSTTSAAPTPTP